ncbi:hypothetical protein [Leifsonia sp. NPDC058230]|uniref:hypothetical protein n=1 Tax=Leifsonia sp. NPDC058230 TaxID=3346391 RepID=UPI0036D9D4E4
MTTTGTSAVEAGELSKLPAGPILVRLRRVLITTAVAAALYTVLSTGSVATCSSGEATDAGDMVQGTCANLVLRPSWCVYAALAVILFVAIGRVARRASTVHEALRLLDRAAIVIVALAVVSAAIGLVWMSLVPLDALTGGGTLIFPFPFSAPELTITHQP